MYVGEPTSVFDNLRSKSCEKKNYAIHHTRQNLQSSLSPHNTFRLRRITILLTILLKRYEAYIHTLYSIPYTLYCTVYTALYSTYTVFSIEELGTRQFCRDNVTIFSGPKVVCYCHFNLFVVATTSRHWGLTIFRLFSSPWLVPEAMLHCRVVVVAKLKSCRVPSSKEPQPTNVKVPDVN